MGADWNVNKLPRLVMLYGRNNAMMASKTSVHVFCNRRRNPIAIILHLLALAWVFLPGKLVAQGLPVETASPIPLTLVFIGAAVLGLVLAYGVVRTRDRSSAEKQLTDRATKNLYAEEERDRKKSGAE
jgi:hypothetical protein